MIERALGEPDDLGAAADAARGQGLDGDRGSLADRAERYLDRVAQTIRDRGGRTATKLKRRSGSAAAK